MNKNVFKILIILTLLAGLSAANFEKKTKSDKAPDVKKLIAHEFNDWSSIDLGVKNSVYGIISPSELMVREYKPPSFKDSVFITSVFTKDREHIHDPQICYKLQGFTFLGSEKALFQDSQEFVKHKALYKNEPYSFIYWYTDFEKTFSSRSEFFKSIFLKKLVLKPLKGYGIIILYSPEKNYKQLFKFAEYLHSKESEALK